MSEDTGYADTGDTAVRDRECEEKREDYYAAKDEFDAEAEIANTMIEELIELQAAFDAAFSDDQTAKEDVIEKQNLYDKAQNGEFPNHPRIEEIKNRLAEIAAYGNMEDRIEELRPILTGDDLSGNVDDAWQETNLLLDLIEEKSDLEAELASLEPKVMQTIAADLGKAKAERERTSTAATEKRNEWAAFRRKAVAQLEKALALKSPAIDAAGRYVDHGCEDSMGSLEPLLELSSKPSQN